MKKILLMVITAAILVMTGCSGNDKPGADPKELATALFDGIDFVDELILAQGEIASNYYKLDDSVAEHYIYISGSGATAEEIAVLKLTSDSKSTSAQAIFDKRIDEQKLRFESYVPKEMSKIEDPVIEIKGDIAVMVMSDNNQKAKEIIKEYM